MEIILHRRNTIESLKNTPSNYGVEIDIRSYGDNLIISHDPFEYGILFSNWIRNYNHGTLVINLKEDGLEKKILYFLEKYNINTYFFLDQSLPSIINNSREKEIICSAKPVLLALPVGKAMTGTSFNNRFPFNVINSGSPGPILIPYRVPIILFIFKNLPYYLSAYT